MTVWAGPPMEVQVKVESLKDRITVLGLPIDKNQTNNIIIKINANVNMTIYYTLPVPVW